MSHPKRYGDSCPGELEPSKSGAYILVKDYIEAMAELDKLRREKHAQQWDGTVGELERRAIIAEGTVAGLRKQVEKLKGDLAVAWDANKRIAEKLEAAKRWVGP